MAKPKIDRHERSRTTHPQYKYLEATAVEDLPSGRVLCCIPVLCSSQIFHPTSLEHCHTLSTKKLHDVSKFGKHSGLHDYVGPCEGPSAA